MKVHKTNRLFYKKYPYKVECSVKGAVYVKRLGYLGLLEVINDEKPGYYNIVRFPVKHKDALLDFAQVVEPIIKEGHQIRAETNTLSFYLEDRATYESVHSRLNQWVKSITEPDSEQDLEILFSKNHITVCNKLPHGKYGFKVMLANHMNNEQRRKVTEWIENFGDSIRFPSKTELWMRGNISWCFDPYLYVESSKQLMMLHLYLGDKIKRTYEFVLRDTQINSVSEDDICQP